MKVAPKGTFEIMATFANGSMVVKLNGKQKWECKENSVIKERFTVSRSGIILNLNALDFDRWFKEIQ